MEQIADNIFVEMENLGSNNTMITTSEGIVLIDSPFKPTDAVNWKKQVDKKGKALYLINTDHHPDHTSGNYFLEGTIISHEETRKKLISNPPEVDLLAYLDPPGEKLLDDYSWRLPTITLSDKMTLHVGEEVIEIFHAPGHSSNMIMVYLPKHKILISGDNVCNGGLPSFQDQNIKDHRKMTETIMNMDIDLIIPGHGDVGPKRISQEYQDLNEEVIDQVAQLIKKNVPKEEIVNTVRYEDKFHSSTEQYKGYSDDRIEHFQIMSINSIYNQLIADY